MNNRLLHISYLIKKKKEVLSPITYLYILVHAQKVCEVNK